MRRLAIRFVSILAGLGVAAAGAVAIVKFTPALTLTAQAATAVHDSFIDATALVGFRLQALTVEGREMTSRDDLLGALDAEAGTPIATIDVAKAREKIEALPWVKRAQIERRLPDTIHVMLEERIPYALWQRGKRYTLVDNDGHTIIDVRQAEVSLPLIVGRDAPLFAAELFNSLKSQPELARRVHAAVRVGERRWNLYLDTYEGGVSIRLPEDNIAEAWERLAALERSDRILERDIEFIDLRLDDKLIVRPRKPATSGPEKPPAVAVKQTL